MQREDGMRNIDRIREMTIDELTEWLFQFGLECVGKGKIDIRRWLLSEDD